MSIIKSKVESRKSKVRGCGHRHKATEFSFPSTSGLVGKVCLIGLVLFAGNACAQQGDTSDKVRINLIHAGSLNYNKTDSGEFNKFIGGVIFQQGTDMLYCDSAYQNSTTKNFEAFSNVRIVQADGTQGTSNYLRYTAAKKLAFMQGDVSLTDGKNNLKCNELTYDLGTKIAVYDDWGTLHNDSTTVTSKTGEYNAKSKEAHFKGNVNIDDPQYKINSEDLVYYTETKVTRFYAKSIVTRDSGRGILQTANGTYDGKNGIAHFLGHSSIWNDGQYIEADTLNYDKLTGYGLANGNVISIDTEHHSKIFCGHAEYFRFKRVLWATIKPVLVQVNGKDTLYMRADTFYSAPMVRVRAEVQKSKAGRQKNVEQLNSKTPRQVDSAVSKEYPLYIVPNAAHDTVDTISRMLFPDIRRDTTWMIPAAPKKKKSKRGKTIEAPVAIDTTMADTTAPIYFIGYHHVRIFSDSLQGKCDSVSYTRSDSTIRMMYSPIVWSHNSQVTGDTILLQLDSNQLRRMYVPDNAFVVSQSGPPKAQLFDQVQGKTLTAYFKDNTITNIVVYPDAECIYYSKDAKNAYLGVDQSSSVRIRIYFDDQKIKTIKFDDNPHHIMTPLDQADIPNTRLSRFKWLIDQRPKTKEELFE